MASVRKRGDLQWQALVRKKGARPMAKTFTNQADAYRWAREVERGVERGESSLVDPRARQVLVRDVMSDYIQHVLHTKKSQNFILNYLRKVEARFSDSFITSITPKDITDWTRDLSAAGSGPQSIRHCITVLNILFKHSMRVFGVSMIELPTKIAARPAMPPGRDRRLLPGEFELMYKLSKSPMRKVLVLAVETGMRRTEITSLDWSQIDLRRRVITLKIGTTKNGKGRSIPLSTRAVAELQIDEPMNVDRITGPVFSWTRPQTVTLNFGHLVKRARKQYEKECARQGRAPDARMFVDLRLHDLRHEAVSRLFEIGLNTMEVASISGHSNLQMLKRYTHFDASQLAQKLG